MTLAKRGLLFAIAAPFLYSLKSLTIKLSPTAGVETFTFFRFFFDFCLLSPLFFLYRAKIQTHRWQLHLGRSFLAAISIACSVYGMQHLILVDAILLENTLPLFIPIILWIWQRKQVSANTMWILGIGFVAIFLLLRPSCHFSHWASLSSLSVGCLCAITGMSLIELSKTEHPIAILFYFNLFSGIISFFPFAYAGLSFPPIDLCMHLVAISFFGVGFQYALIQSYASISPQLVGSLVYSSIFYSAILGWWIWGEKLDTVQLCGAVLLIASCLAMIRQSGLENQKSKSC